MKICRRISSRASPFPSHSKKASAAFFWTAWVVSLGALDLGSLSAVMKASLDELQERVPLDRSVLESLVAWFRCPVFNKHDSYT